MLTQLEKYKKADFGRCPRVLCFSHPLLPIGLTDIPYEKAVKLYCPRCEDLYSPKSSRHGSIDGAYFGTTFPHILFMVYPTMIPMKAPDVPRAAMAEARPEKGGLSVVGSAASTATVALKAEIHRPTIFGFQVNEVAKLQRWQIAMRDRFVFKISRPGELLTSPSCCTPLRVHHPTFFYLFILRQIARLEEADQASKL